MAWADLHLHSICSDGTDTPARVAERAAAAGATLIALSDHDTLAGVAECETAARAAGLDFIAGVEITVRDKSGEVHMLAYGVRRDHPALNALLAEQQHARRDRAVRILRRLNARGVQITLDEVASGAAVHSLGRLDIARALLAKGYVKDAQAAFDRWLGKGKPGYVAKPMPAMEDAIDLVHAAGGVALLAHPGIAQSLYKRTPRLLEHYALDGLEAYHSSHSPGQTSDLLALAQERGLLVSGGSDCHGDAKGCPLLGRVRLPMAHVDALRARLGR